MNTPLFEFAFQVLEGPSANRLLWTRLNLQNSSAQAVEIARKELSSICRACGKLQVRDSAQLHDVPLVVSVKIKKLDDGNLSNEVVGYKSVKDFAEKQSQQSQVSQSASAGKPSWL